MQIYSNPDAWPNFPPCCGDPNKGTITAEKTTDGVWIVTDVQAQSGWGPMLYDAAMEYATELGAGLAPHSYIRHPLGKDSPSSERVWKHYYERRGDVTKSEPQDAEKPWLHAVYQKLTDILDYFRDAGRVKKI